MTGIVDRIPVLSRLLSEIVRIEFIDRCMLIAAQALLALIPMLVVVAAFVPRLNDNALQEFSIATGMGATGVGQVHGDLDLNQVRDQTGLIGLAITVFSATSFARAVQRMYERTWEQRHIGGLVGTRRCFLWLVGWMIGLQLLFAGRRIANGPQDVAVSWLRLAVQMAVVAAVWWVTARLLLFGRVSWGRLALGAALTGVVEVLYNRASALLMPAYVRADARQFGTLGVILAISTWLIGFAGILVGGALVGRVVSEDPTVLRLVGYGRSVVARLRGVATHRDGPDLTASRGEPPDRPPGG